MKSDFKIGFFFSALAQYSNIIGQLLINIVLSHLLKPQDFGIVTMIQVISIFFNLIASSAIPAAIVQNKALNDEDYGVIFNYTVIFGILLSLIFGALGFLLAFLFHDNVYIPVTWSLTILVFADALNAVPSGILLKEKKFKAISLRQTIGVFLAAIIGISAAFMGFGLYALVLVLTIPQVIFLIFNFFTVKISYTSSLRKSSIQKILNFVIHQANFSVLNYGYRNMDNLLVGKFLGANALGNYAKSYQLLSAPITVFLGVVNPVLQPVLSEFQDDVAYIRETYLKLSQLLALFALPLSVFVFFNAKEIIYFLFGHQWTGAILPLAILSLSIWAQMLAQMIPPIWQSRNLTKKQTYNGIISFVIICISIVIGVIFGHLETVAAAVSISYIVNFVISAHYLLKKGLNSSIFIMLKGLIKPILLAFLLAVVYYFSSNLTTFSSLFLTLIIRGIILIVIVFGFLTFTGDLKKIIRMIKND